MISYIQLLTCTRQSKLSAGHSCIYCTPKIVTNCAPDIVITDLHTSLCGSASLQSDGSSSTSSNTSHSSILKVGTVVATQCTSRTVNESSLSSTTLDIIQPDLTSTISKTSSKSSSTYYIKNISWK